MCQGSIQRNTHNVLQNKINVEKGVRVFKLSNMGLKKLPRKRQKIKASRSKTKLFNYRRTPRYQHPLNTDTSLLRTLFFVRGKSLTFSLN